MAETKTRARAGRAKDLAPAQPQPNGGAQPAQPDQPMTGVITIVEDGTIAIQGITLTNAGSMARIMIGIANELMNLSAQPQPNGTGAQGG